jgi:hypothetical protein
LEPVQDATHAAVPDVLPALAAIRAAAQVETHAEELDVTEREGRVPHGFQPVFPERDAIPREEPVATRAEEQHALPVQASIPVWPDATPAEVQASIPCGFPEQVSIPFVASTPSVEELLSETPNAAARSYGVLAAQEWFAIQWKAVTVFLVRFVFRFSAQQDGIRFSPSAYAILRAQFGAVRSPWATRFFASQGRSLLHLVRGWALGYEPRAEPQRALPSRDCGDALHSPSHTKFYPSVPSACAGAAPGLARYAAPTSRFFQPRLDRAEYHPDRH